MNMKHGKSQTIEYHLWERIKAKCHNPKSANYSYYGGRGITMHQPWRHSFTQFYDDLLAEIGPKPSPDYSLDRKDNMQGYAPGNLRWATRTEQQNNTRYNRLVTIENRTQSLKQWCDELDLKYNTVAVRVLRGWSAKRALRKR